MQLDETHIAQLLLEGDYLQEADVARAQKYANQHESSFVDALLALGLINKALLGQAIAEDAGVPYTPLSSEAPDVALVTKIPEALARAHGVVAYSSDATGGVHIATASPSDTAMSSAVLPCFPELSPEKIFFSFAFPEDIEKFFLYYRKPLSTRFADIIAANKKIAPEITEEILRDALDYAASDIHFEPQEKGVIIRFRVDGVLYQAGKISREYYQNILNRIKVLAQLRVDEHNTSQDGAIRHQVDKQRVDIRVSIVPTVEGEKVVMRILSRHVNTSSFLELGLSPEHQKLLAEASKRPSGMIILSGPTGSGKTTTLYTIVNTLNTPEVNITTIEDPVEYKMHGVNQIQVNAQTNITFANGLRSIVRQDPNVILVGEIRDTETAEISTNAALTGHLVLSSFHAIDTASTITRLLHMGVDATVLASTIELIITQRLVRKICETCRTSTNLSHEELIRQYPSVATYFTAPTVTLFHGAGCNSCSGFGYNGRTGIFEFMPMTPALREAIMQHPTLSEIRRIAHEAGMSSIFADGVEKVTSGVTTVAELLRVATPRED
jgi:type II secretory ATPase GspE/PulE/Tfp pilus assembly ATPase PilB-like protein